MGYCFDLSSKQADDWLRLRRSTSIQTLQLYHNHKGTVPRHIIVLTTPGPSVFILERKVKDLAEPETYAILLESVQNAPASTCLIKLDFSDESGIDLALVLAICRKYELSNLKKLDLPDFNELFPLAFTAVAARKSVPTVALPHQFITNTHLGLAWNELLVSTEKHDLFWETTIVAKTNDKIRGRVRMAARVKIETALRETNPGLCEGSDDGRRVLAGSVVAWFEAQANETVSIQLDKWHKTWAMRWDKQWAAEAKVPLFMLAKCAPLGVNIRNATIASPLDGYLDSQRVDISVLRNGKLLSFAYRVKTVF
jgi:hypothetical protein